MPGHDRRHYTRDYQRRARNVREAANADPLTTCWRCGCAAREGDPWQAGHTRDGDSTGSLWPEHRSCNARAGARMGNRRRYDPQSQEW